MIEGPSAMLHTSNLSGLRVLLMADSVSKLSSGGLVVNRLIELLVANGAIVEVFSESEDSNSQAAENIKITYSSFTGFQHIKSGSQALVFQRVLTEFNPDIIHWCSLDYLKSRHLIKIAKSTKARLIAQPWVYNFFCSQGYNYYEGFICNKCLPNKFYNAIFNSCGESRSQSLQAVSRMLYRQDILKFDKFLSTGIVMDEILVSYGIEKRKIERIALPFNRSRLDYLNSTVSEERKSFVYYGQFKEFKGANQLASIANANQLVAFDIYSTLDSRSAADMAAQGLDKLKNVKLFTDRTWRTGLDINVAEAYGVILPSLWPTSTEYVLLEAMSLRKPVVAYNVGANKDLLRNYENAIVVEPGDLTGFCEAVAELNANPELRARLGEKASQTIDVTFSDTRLLDALEVAYLN
jgi:glycosyltransferase involved in cell wall biosynthesis